MQLNEFISETLVQIAKGIDAANAQLADSTAKVNPLNVYPIDEKYSSTIYGHIQKGGLAVNPVVHLIRFDVAVFAAEGKETKGGIGIMVGTIGLGTQGKSDASASTTSRIQFGIPMLLPSPKT
jgi:hypothetical protein